MYTMNMAGSLKERASILVHRHSSDRLCGPSHNCSLHIDQPLYFCILQPALVDRSTSCISSLHARNYQTTASAIQEELAKHKLGQMLVPDCHTWSTSTPASPCL